MNWLIESAEAEGAPWPGASFVSRFYDGDAGGKIRLTAVHIAVHMYICMEVCVSRRSVGTYRRWACHVLPRLVDVRHQPPLPWVTFFSMFELIHFALQLS